MLCLQVAIMCGDCPTTACKGIYVLQAFAYSCAICDW